MTFLNAALLAGLAAVAIPVILHFLLKQKPKKLLFPALRLIEQRRKQSMRRMRLKHFWLMLLRMLVFAAIVFALARPSLPPANYSLTRWELATLIGVALLGMGTYVGLLKKANSQLPQFQYEERKASLRGWLTGGTLVLLLLVVGWPYQRRIAAEITDPTPSVPLDVPVAAVFLFDTSLSMGYQQEGATRVDVARDIAANHLRELPNGSRIAVADNGADHPITFQSSLQAANARLTALEVLPLSNSLDERLRDALRAQGDDRKRTLEEFGGAEDARQDRFVRRVYLFTDLAATAWKANSGARIQADLEKLPGVTVYVIDVGQEQPQNLGVTEVQLSRERIASGGDLIVSAVVTGTGLESSEQTLELLLANAQGNTTKHGQVTVKAEPGTPVRCEFPLVTGVTGPVIHGEVRIAGADPLVIDNTRYFSALVTPTPKVLIVSSEPADANELQIALAPYEDRDAVRNKFEPVPISAVRLSEADLSQYAAVCLVNVNRLPDDGWFRLGKYVEGGGGLAIFLGSDQLNSVSYNRAQAQAFLPASLDVYQPENDWRMLIGDRQHSVFWKFRQHESYGAFAMFEGDVWVSRFWKVQPAEGANVIATYSDPDRSPCLVERTYGRGRTVLFTTAVNLPANARQRWTNLPSPLLAPWLFVAFTEQLTEYVSRFTDAPHNYIVGEAPVIPVEPQPTERQFLLREPLFKQRPVKLAANEPKLTVPQPTDLGHYELVDSATAPPWTGFSVNGSAEESNLLRLTTQQLDDLLGKDRYQLARTIDELKDDITAADLGQEVFPVVLALLIALFLGEHLVANWFYETNHRDLASAG